LVETDLQTFHAYGFQMDSDGINLIALSTREVPLNCDYDHTLSRQQEGQDFFSVTRTLPFGICGSLHFFLATRVQKREH
jgi:hypothetical protein